MTAYVRVRKLEDLRRCITHAGTQVDVAAASGLSTTRLNQICVGKHKRLSVDKAERLERALGVPLGSLFVAVDAHPAPYLSSSSDSTGGGSDTGGGNNSEADSEPAYTAA